MYQSRNWDNASELLNDPEAVHTKIVDWDALVERVESAAGVFYFKSTPTDNASRSGKEFAANAQATFDERLLALQRGLGHDSLEQLLAYSEPETTIITHELPGKHLADLEPEQVRGIPKTHVANLLLTFQSMEERGILPDTGTLGNFTYETATGFGVLDYTITPPNAGFKRAANEFTSFLKELGDINPRVANTVAAKSGWHNVQQIGVASLLNEYGGLDHPDIRLSDPNIAWVSGMMLELSNNLSTDT